MPSDRSKYEALRFQRVPRRRGSEYSMPPESRSSPFLRDSPRLLPKPNMFCSENEKRPVVSFPSRRSEEHTSELQSQSNLVCRLLLEKKKQRSALTRAGESPVYSLAP